MSTFLLKARLALELPSINGALDEMLDSLPAPTRPAAAHTVKSGGKRLRPILTILCARLFGCKNPSLYRLASTLELLHAATLMHDDVIDNADTRRGKPSAHTIFGTTQTILAGDALLSKANDCVAEFDQPELCRIFSKATYETAAGEILELGAMHNAKLSNEEYLDIIRGKTACLIRSACEMGAVFAKAPKAAQEALSVFGENIGIAFQIVDDALDCAPASVIGKPSGGDIREGKLTPPVRMYRESLSEGEKEYFDRKFVDGGFKDEEIESMCAAIRDQGLDARTRDLANECLEKAKAALHALPKASERDLLEEMIDYVKNRNH